MRISDYVEQSLSNLRKKKLRTFLTTSGVVIGIGALVSMMSFGKGVQKNVTDKFNELELFNYVSVYPASGSGPMRNDPDHSWTQEDVNSEGTRMLDDALLAEIEQMDGVKSVFAEERFPAMLRLEGKDQFSLVQVLPVEVCRSGLMELRAGEMYSANDANELIISDSLLRRMGVKEPDEAVGKEIELSTLKLSLGILNPGMLIGARGGQQMPFAQERRKFKIVGVAERMGFGGSLPLRSNVYITPGAAAKMEKVTLTKVSDFFRGTDETMGYSMVNVRLSSVRYVEPVKKQVKEWGLRTFALVDQFGQIKKAFVFMDMFLLAVGMVAIVVASLGIINTMVMSILERYQEIGIMKAVGASDADVQKIFMFEAGTIGFFGGVFGLMLGWAVSSIINIVINTLTSRQGVPTVDYFSFPWWLCLGSIVFSVLVSLLAGIYPTLRAARVDPVIALRHD
jgi:putative ABC transport system permease protein